MAAHTGNSSLEGMTVTSHPGGAVEAAARPRSKKTNKRQQAHAGDARRYTATLPAEIRDQPVKGRCEARVRFPPCPAPPLLHPSHPSPIALRLFFRRDMFGMCHGEGGKGTVTHTTPNGSGRPSNAPERGYDGLGWTRAPSHRSLTVVFSLTSAATHR